MSQQTGGGVPRLRLLIDTNVFIAIEPYDGTVEAGLAPGAELLRLINQQGHRVFVHPATRDDLLQGQDAVRRQQRLAELAKFEMLTEVAITSSLIARAGDSAPGSNDHRDLRLLAALDAHAVTYLISDDGPLRRRATRAGLESVLTIAEAVQLLRGFVPAFATPPPHVDAVPAYALDIEQPIFDSLRADYPDFDAWLDKVRHDTDNRRCLVIRDPDGAYAALAIVKLTEPDCTYPLRQPVMKIATFKVAEQHARNKYGELLLKAILMGVADRAATLYVEVLPQHQVVVDFMAEFGFSDSGQRTDRGELVLAKCRIPEASAASLDPLEYHCRYGPPALKPTGTMWVVPIEPEWHQQLFPDAPAAEENDEQLEIPGFQPRTHPWGNALRKAYLCNSNVTRMAPGDTLLFYRSHDQQAITAIGVVEDKLRSSDANDILSFVGRRTVYTPSEVADLCRSVRQCLAIMFRQDRFIDPPWVLAELEQQRVLNGPPQSITRVRDGGIEWVQQRLAVSP